MRRRLVGGGVALVALLVMGWLWLPAERRPLRPSETVRALKARLKRQRPAPPPAPRPVLPAPVQTPSPQAEPLRLWVQLRRVWEPDLTMDDTWYELSLPQSYWPHADEVDWPDLPSVDGLQQLADAGTELEMRRNAPFLSEPNETWVQGREAVHAVLEQAEQDGIFADGPVWDRYQEDDPWALLHQAQIHRAAELVTSYDGRPRTGFTQRGVLSETRFLANRLVDADPQHPAADYARLMLLEAVIWDTDEAFRLRQPQLAVDTIVQTLEASDDPLVTQSAMVSLMMTDLDDLAEADVGPLLDRLDQEVDTLPHQLREGVAAVALSLALDTEPARAMRWAELLEGADPDREGAVFDREAMQEAQIRMAMRGLRAPTTWEGELRTRIATCHTNEPVPEALFVLEGAWDQGWTFTDQTEEGALPSSLLGCLSSGTSTVAPPSPMLVLKLDGRRPGG